ncbi:hypothetical protein MNEG_15694 [Monoraphidium neglectum]|uniref:Uncharacterized protein n=1 Tax=Monoraphidium neglectum TaxID=145388 RepID=A0A0D2LJW4_9CHLO|nr:hypothetical protein MNEG_15694 [Monoraphidium neglectum]KIY92269.1 hypothetical protein MNEG_15694 [Monoraphidium neglectum]|eukprot:XP_013891289.1 hypothetical protein MNEG_15694 [Monoraphidium neglectum]
MLMEPCAAKHISHQSIVADLQGASPQVLLQVTAAANTAQREWQRLLDTVRGEGEEEEASSCGGGGGGAQEREGGQQEEEEVAGGAAAGAGEPRTPARLSRAGGPQDGGAVQAWLQHQQGPDGPPQPETEGQRAACGRSDRGNQQVEQGATTSSSQGECGSSALREDPRPATAFAAAAEAAAAARSCSLEGGGGAGAAGGMGAAPGPWGSACLSGHPTRSASLGQAAHGWAPRGRGASSLGAAPLEGVGGAEAMDWQPADEQQQQQQQQQQAALDGAGGQRAHAQGGSGQQEEQQQQEQQQQQQQHQQQQEWQQQRQPQQQEQPEEQQQQPGERPPALPLPSQQQQQQERAPPRRRRCGRHG